MQGAETRRATSDGRLWREMMEQKAFRRKLWVTFGSSTKNVGTLHRQKNVGQISLVGCGKRGRNTRLELVRRSGLSFFGLLMRQAYYAGRSGGWEGCNEEFRKDGRLSDWASKKVKEVLRES